MQPKHKCQLGGHAMQCPADHTTHTFAKVSVTELVFLFANCNCESKTIYILIFSDV